MPSATRPPLPCYLNGEYTLLPVTRIDGQPVGSGRPGPIYAQLYAGCQAIKAQSRQEQRPPDRTENSST